MIDSIKNSTISDLNWNFLCYIHNDSNLYFNIKSYLYKYDFDNCITDTIKFSIDYVDNKNTYLGLIDFYDLTLNLYKYINNLQHYNTYNNIQEIKNYVHLLNLTSISRKYIMNHHDDYSYFYRYICSDFPLNSDFNHIITTKVIKDDTIINLNYNINTNNSFIKDLLGNFIESLDTIKYKKSSALYLFLSYFIESFNNKVPLSYENINDELFRTQYYFYSELDIRHENILSGGYKPTHILIHFYRFLSNKNIKEYGTHIFSTSLTQAMDTKNFNKYYSDGYTFLYHAKSEPVPLHDKICILPSSQTLNNSLATNKNLMSYDLTSFDAKYKQDVKNFIWYSDGNFSSTIGYLSKLKDFFNIKQEYELLFKNVSFLDTQSDTEFNDDFLYFYRSIIELDYPIPSSLKGVLKIVRKYLKYFKSKYKVTDTHLDILNLKKLESFDGGTPITDHDVELIYKEFESRESSSELGRLHTIVFELFIHTNLRIGSILNLTRDCLIYNNDGTVTLEYLSKTSSQEKVIQLINPTIVKLIEEALSITSTYLDSDINNRYKHFIFVHKYLSNRMYGLKRVDFYNYFKNIISYLDNQLDNTNYYPYNIRHTYMHNVFKNGVALDLDITEMSAIAGISYKTANLYYRNTQDIDLYVEALAKVTISNVDINGDILENSDSDDINCNPVKSGLGNCKLSGCNVQSGECFRCFNFVTFINRIPYFESSILECDDLIKKCTNPIEKDFYLSQKKLLAAYLSKMLKIQKSKR